MIHNRNHVRGIRDMLHVGIQQFAKENGLGNGDLQGEDVACALAWVLRDIIKEAPDAQMRASIAAGARYAIDDAGRTEFIMPGLVN
jgi:hypothetical protein